MLDADLAAIYRVSTKRLDEQAKRNRARFPDDFMFQLTAAEKAEVVAGCDHLQRLELSPSLPYAFTEHGATMLASVLIGPVAICRGCRRGRMALERPSESGYTFGQKKEERAMRFASVAQVKDGLSEYLSRAQKKKEPIVVTHHGKPYALIRPIEESDLEELEWKQLARRKLARAWEGEEDALYDYL
jgi:prevent-host-death family protein